MSKTYLCLQKAKRKEVKLLEEKLIEIQNSEKIIIEPVYFLQGIPHTIDKCYVRETVAKKILKIANSLQKGFKSSLVILVCPHYEMSPQNFQYICCHDFGIL